MTTALASKQVASELHGGPKSEITVVANKIGSEHNDGM